MKKYLLLAALLGFTSPACGAPWTIDYPQSKLGFVGTQGSAKFEGSFKSFAASVDFDPDHPDAGKIDATIDIGSVTAGSSDRDSYLPQPDWFNTKQFPQAQFTSASIKKTGDHTYEAAGKLTIKGITQNVTLPFTLVQEKDGWRATGKVTLMRNDFRIGEHDWSNEDYVKHAVDVVIDLKAKP